MKKINGPSLIKTSESSNKLSEEFIGLVNTNTPDVSIVKVRVEKGWEENFYIPEYDEYILMLKGCLHVENEDTKIVLEENQTLIVPKGEKTRFSTPVEKSGATYFSICLPAFSPRSNRKKLE